MTRRHFEKLAEMMRLAKGSIRNTTDPVDLWERMVYDLHDILKEENPRFDSARFVCACRGLKRPPKVKEISNRVHSV